MTFKFRIHNRSPFIGRSNTTPVEGTMVVPLVDADVTSLAVEAPGWSRDSADAADTFLVVDDLLATILVEIPLDLNFHQTMLIFAGSIRQMAGVGDHFVEV